MLVPLAQNIISLIPNSRKFYIQIDYKLLNNSIIKIANRGKKNIFARARACMYVCVLQEISLHKITRVVLFKKSKLTFKSSKRLQLLKKYIYYDLLEIMQLCLCRVQLSRYSTGIMCTYICIFYYRYYNLYIF